MNAADLYRKAAVTKAIEVLGRLDSATRSAFFQRLDSLPAFP
ncbi:MAG: hypothetical protein ACLQIB_35065 [Isosphaeraceae bacterium]